MISLDIPGAVVEGEIYDADDNPLLLEEGMLHVEVAGHSIDVSWLPEHDPQGRYQIVVYREVWEDKMHEIDTRDPVEAARIVTSLAEWLSQGVVNLPASTTSTIYSMVG